MRLALAAMAVAWLLSGAARAQLVDGVAAVVDKEVILLSEVEFAANMVLGRLESQQQELSPEIVRGIYHDALQSLIDSKLVERYADRANLVASPEEIEMAIEGIAQEEGVDPEAVYLSAEQQGLSRETYRRELGRQITQMKVISGSVQGRIDVTGEEIQALYEERYASQKPGLRVRVRHILLPWPADMDPDKQQRMHEIATTIRERAIETGDFANLARQYSRAPSAPDGGLTTFREGEVTPEIAAAVFDLPPGEVTSVVETDHGLNIFQILNRFDPSQITLEDVEPNLRAELIDRKTLPEFQKWVEGLRENRYIEIVKPELRR